MISPKTLIKNDNSITLIWNKLTDNESSTNKIVKLQICNEFKEWQTIYCGPKNQFKVNNLAQCTCYNFRIKIADNSNRNWKYFNGVTNDPGPYTFTMHMTRAIKLKKILNIRRMAHLTPVLINAENKDHKTPLIQAIEQHEDLQILQILISLGARVNKPQLITGRTPLMMAVYKGQLTAASLLIEKGADIFSVDINGMSILHHAVDSNKLENVVFALKCKVPINLKDNCGWTPLIRAGILNCNQEIKEFLIKENADELIKDRNGYDYKRHLKLHDPK